MPDVFLHLPKSLTSQAATQLSAQNLTILYFIPGNPGLIEYYFSFLDLLADQSRTWNGNREARDGHGDVIIAGASLGGFEAPLLLSSGSIHTSTSAATSPAVSDTPTGTKKSADSEAIKKSLLPLYPPSFSKSKATGTYTLQDEISLTYARIDALVQGLQRLYLNTSEISSSRPINVILGGHSVGAYIALEIIRHHHDRLHSTHSYSTDSAPSPDSPVNSHWSITSTLLLTPTITNIALSPSGRIATPLLTYLPLLPTLLQLGASGMTGYLPRSLVRNIVRRVTGMKNQDMVDVTVTFLGRPGCVRQALEMAGHEMREITERAWDDVVWGAVGANECGEVDGKGSGDGNEEMPVEWKAPMHYFLFARSDHWVADETREVILRRMHGRAKIVVDGEGGMGIVHAWCLEQSVVVAGIVRGWMGEILGDSQI